MKLLVDTHLLLWAAGRTDKLSPKALQLLSDPDNTLVFSSASIWEVAIKTSLGRSDFQVDPRRLWRMLLANGYQELHVTGSHAVHVESLPALHKDPFARILIAQAREEGLTLITADDIVASYGTGVERV